MKKLMFLVLAFCATNLFSQEKDSDKIMKMLDIVKNNMENKKVLDSLKIEIEKYKDSTDPVVKIMYPQTKSMIDDLATMSKNNVQSKNLSELSKEDLKGFRIEEDKFKNRTFIYYKKWGFDTIFEPYIGIKNNSMYLRLKTEYKGNGWLFFDKVQFVINGKNYEYDAGETDTNVLSGSSVEELSDVSVDENILKILYLISDVNNDVSFRFKGKYYRDYTLNKSAKEKIKIFLNLYEKLKK